MAEDVEYSEEYLRGVNDGYKLALLDTAVDGIMALHMLAGLIDCDVIDMTFLKCVPQLDLLRKDDVDKAVDAFDGALRPLAGTLAIMRRRKMHDPLPGYQ